MVIARRGLRSRKVPMSGKRENAIVQRSVKAVNIVASGIVSKMSMINVEKVKDVTIVILMVRGARARSARISIISLFRRISLENQRSNAYKNKTTTIKYRMSVLLQLLRLRLGWLLLFV